MDALVPPRYEAGAMVMLGDKYVSLDLLNTLGLLQEMGDAVRRTVVHGEADATHGASLVGEDDLFNDGEFGDEDNDELPVGNEDDDELPVGNEDDNELPVGNEDDDELPVGNEDDDELPVGQRR